MHPGKDFVEVKLSAKGEELAGGSPLGICVGRFNFVFKAGESQRVLKADWEVLLSQEHVNGEHVFEITKRTLQQVAQTSPAAVTGPTPKQ
jgi:hypothetical protein